MKKLFVLGLSLVSIFYLSNAAFSEVRFAVKGSIDLMGKTELDADEADTDTGDVDNSLGIGAEIMAGVSNQVVLGGGAVYQLPRGVDENDEIWEDAEFNYLPVYGLAKVYFIPKGTKPFFVINIGYGLLFGDIPWADDLEKEGGLYWGLGGGVEFENGFFIEGLYTQNNGTVTGDVYGYEITGDHKYTKVSIFFGYKF